MLWIALALLIVACWLIYTKRKGKVTLTKGQAGTVLGLVEKERAEIEQKRQAIIGDKNSLSLGLIVGDSGLVCQGKTRHIMLGQGS